MEFFFFYIPSKKVVVLKKYLFGTNNSVKWFSEPSSHNRIDRYNRYTMETSKSPYVSRATVDGTKRKIATVRDVKKKTTDFIVRVYAVRWWARGVRVLFLNRPVGVYLYTIFYCARIAV